MHFLVYFTVRYQKMKMYVKLLIWGKETTLQETCLLSDYGHVRHQNARKHRKYPIWKTIHHYQLLLFSVFLRNTYLRSKNSFMEKQYNFTKNVNFQSFWVYVQKCMESTLYGEKKTLKETCIMRVIKLLRYQSVKRHE